MQLAARMTVALLESFAFAAWASTLTKMLVRFILIVDWPWANLRRALCYLLVL